MERPLLVVLAVAAVAVVAVGLSAAATMSRGDSKEPTRAVQPEKQAKSVQPARQPASERAQTQSSAPAVTSSGRSQSAKDVESYWTKEQMDNAQPMGKTRPGGSPSSSPEPSGSSAPGSAPTKSTPQKSRTKKSQSAAGTGVVTGPAATPNPGYWDDEAMDGAQPMDKTRPGGGGSGSSDPGGPTTPGSPPP